MTSRRLRTLAFKLLRFAFRCVPTTEATRDRLRARFLDRYSHFVPPPPRGQDAGVRRETRPRGRAGARAIGYRERAAATPPTQVSARLIAFYLPQFHPIPQNDAWWGTGFTEWHNVTRALPQFEGHQQPRLPADLGFYDLRAPEVMRAQATLAREAGIEGFCSYFYWFGGKTLLEAPLRGWLDDRTIELPLCLCWANENWSRRWDGRAEDVLIAQSHNAEDDVAFIAYIADYLRDPRYIRVGGNPLLVVYRPHLLPDAAATASRWRDWCRDAGIGEIHIAYVQGFERPDPRDIGFDAAIEFPPNMSTPPSIVERQALLNPDFHGDVLDWRALAADMAGRPLPAYPLYPGVNPGWDNEPRRSGRGRVFAHSSPRGYRDWLRTTIHGRLRDVTPADRIVFINAWNEWAEGAVLEPDTRFGHAWLVATREALALPTPVPAQPPCAVIHAWYPEVLPEILSALSASGLVWRIVITTGHTQRELVQKCLGDAELAADIRVFPNHGRDILPFLHIADELLDEGQQVVLKLHTKRSTHRSDGDAWRAEMLESLVAPDRAAALLSAFEDPALGIVAPEGHVHPLCYFLSANEAAIGHLLRRTGTRWKNDDPDLTFPAGSMFWIRLDVLRPLLDAHLSNEDFEPEAGQLDGTLAHAIERLVGLLAHDASLRIDDAASVSGSAPLRSRTEPYAYARRS